MAELRCQHCKTTNNIDLRKRAKEFRCAHCGRTVLVEKIILFEPSLFGGGAKHCYTVTRKAVENG